MASRSSLQPFNLVLMVVGIVLGVIVGVLPGLGGANGIAILLPLTFSACRRPRRSSCCPASTGARCSAAPSPRCCSTYPANRGRWRPPSTAIRWRRRASAGEALTAAFTSSFVGALFAVIMITLVAPLVASFALRIRPAGNLLGLFPRLLQLRRPEQGAAVQDHRLDDARLRARRRRPRSDDRAIAADLRRSEPLLNGFDFLIAVIGLFGIGEILLTMEEGLSFRGKAARDQPEGGVADLEGVAALLDALAALLPDRLLDGHQPGGRDARLVHELRHRQAHLQARPQFRHRRDRGRGGAGNRRARRRHLGAAADDLARRAGLADRRGAARRPA